MRRLITIGTPHAGSLHAWMMRGTALVDMRPDRFEDLIALVRNYNPRTNDDLIRRAYAYGRKMHDGQLRQSGEAYFTHPVAVGPRTVGDESDPPRHDPRRAHGPPHAAAHADASRRAR